MTALPSALHDARGARRDDTSALPRNYGDPAAEYDAARSSAALIDRADRALVRVHGRDPVRMIQGLISNDIGGLGEDRAVYAAVLTPKGRMIADVRVLRTGEELLLDTDMRALEPLLAHLKKFVPPLFARAENVTDAWSVIGVYGPGATRVLHSVFDMQIDDVQDAITIAGGVRIIATHYTGDAGADIIVPHYDAVALWERIESAGARPIGHATLDVLRIEAGQPRWGAELDESTIPLEAGLRARAISETKGCYTGQEVIIRILHRGHVNRHLRGVLLGDVAAPARDTELFNDGRAVGRITSAAWSPRHAQTIALAYVRREIVPPADVRLGSAAGAEVRVVELPFGAS
jgi:folate-binding protein YgfZ